MARRLITPAADTARTSLLPVSAIRNPPSAVTATPAGHQAAAAEAFETAWRRARGLRVPLALALLEISDARRLRAAGQPQAAVARLRSARQRLITLGARPYLEICDRELAAAGAPVEPETAPAFVGLTPAEQAVARLVGTGRTNRQTAAELYVSVKTVESHLGHIYAKLGIRSRKGLINRISAPRGLSNNGTASGDSGRGPLGYRHRPFGVTGLRGGRMEDLPRA